MSRSSGRARARSATVAATCVGSALMLWQSAAWSQLVAIDWHDGGRFERRLTVPPGKVAELCGALQPGQAVAWSFQSDRPLDFNIHYHVGTAVRFAAKADQVESLNGDLAVDASQDHCWMWTNKTAVVAKLAVTLRRP